MSRCSTKDGGILSVTTALKHFFFAGLAVQAVLGSFFFLLNLPTQRLGAVLKKTRQSPSCPPPSSSCVPPEASNSLEYDTFLLVLILSEKDKVAERQAARDTWMSKVAYNKKRTMVKFIVGIMSENDNSTLKLKGEVDVNGDIVFIPWIGAGFEGVNLKRVLEWARTHISFRYLMKVKGDVYVMIEEVVQSLETLDTSGPLIWGSILFDGDEYKNVENGLPFTSESDSLFGFPIPKSPGYVMSKSIVHAIFVDEYNTPVKLFSKEDITLGLWLSTFNIEYRKLSVYVHTGEKPLCPNDKSAVMMYQYADPVEGFHKLHMCLKV